jgi:hypothetical protein
VEGWKNIFQANETQKQVGIAPLISDNADFKLKPEETRRLLYIDKRNNPSIGYNNYKHICTECWCT